MRPVRPMRIVTAVVQSPLNARHWHLQLKCGHAATVFARRRPQRVYAPCARCAESTPDSSKRGDVHAGCGGRWSKPEPALERAVPGLVDRCTKCGEERA